MAEWKTLSAWLDSVDALLANNAEIISGAERCLRGTGFTDAVREERRAIAAERRAKEAARAERDHRLSEQHALRVSRCKPVH